MRTGNSLVFSGIAPHPPIMVPEVGRDAIRDVRGSIDAMAELTRRIIASGAETVVLISPHAPLEARAFVAYDDPTLHGNFENFRAPEAIVESFLDEDLLLSIARTASAQDLEVMPLEHHELDHGTAVPLYFLRTNGWTGRVVALGYSFLSNDEHLQFGECIQKAAAEIARPIALIASGDLSHRLKPDAPAGYNPSAYLFDEQVVDAIECNEPERIVEIDPKLRRLAGECGFRSMLVALGASRQLPPAGEVLHYEAPFGVGYMVAQITCAAAKNSGVVEHMNTQNDLRDLLPGLARKAIETYITTGERIHVPSDIGEAILTRAACFVSIRTHEGELRGCIGTIEPAEKSLAEELVTNAIGAATRDPRFPPVTHSELIGLRYSVDILSPPEPATFEDLDPYLYGVVVEDERGLRGLLLPDIEGVNTTTQQVEIAVRKAGIPPGSPLKFFRFRVDRFREQVE